jgi:signal transduction histidine kinase
MAVQQKSKPIRLSITTRFILALLLILTISVVGFYLVFRPPLDEVWLMTGYLLITTILSAIAGYAAYRLGWMNRSPNIRTALLGSYGLACFLTFINVWLTARLMFIEPHDLLLGTVLLVFAGAIAMALGYLLSSSFLDRIQYLDQAAKKIAEGNLSIRIPVDGRDELADLAQTFNKMAAQLEEASEKRRQLDALRKELIAWIGHDLQTPLASVSAIIEALGDGMVDDPETEKRYFLTAKKNISALSDLIDDMFQMAQIDAGGLDLNYENVSINDLISDTIESFSEIAKRKEVSLTGNVAPEIGMVHIDPQRINRVLNNLVDNAIRHTPENGKVEVCANATENGLSVEVIDNGMGIPSADLPYIFDLFYRGEVSRRSTKAGTGLGLAISKGIIEAHGGTIEVQSDSQLTKFVINLPID